MAAVTDTEARGRQQPAQPADCPHCSQPDSLRALDERLAKCHVCHYLFPRPWTVPQHTVVTELEALSSIAPNRILRERYRLVAPLGKGAHGTTYFAEHEFLNHPCVIKILPHRIADSTDAAVRRLRHEARVGFRVNHPNVVRVLDCDAIQDVWYFAMEFIDGVNLAALASHSVRVGWQQAVEIGIDTASGLAAIHRTGIIHRDIKPANLIMTTDGRTCIADLGVAGLAEGHGEFEEDTSAVSVGTLDYAAPEAFLADASVGPQADLYSLGAVLYQLVTGQRIRAGQGTLAALVETQSRPASWPADAPKGAPEWFIEGILQLLATDPKDRYPSAEAFEGYLRQGTARRTQVRTEGPREERLEPRGVAVLPLHNDSGNEADDWLGFAVSEYLARSLAQVRGVYVARHDDLLERMEHIQQQSGNEPRVVRLLEAGRLVGASVVVEGNFRRNADLIEVSLDAYRAGESAPIPIARVEGPLSQLVDLQTTLLDALLRSLELAAKEMPETGMSPASATAQEKYVLARQAYLKGNYELAIELATDAVNLDPEFVEPVGHIGVCYARLGVYEEAVRHHRQQQDVARRRGDARLLAEAQANMGAMHYFKGEYETAYDLYAKAAQTAEKAGLTTELAQVDNNLGFVLFRLGRQADAEKAFLHAIETHKAYGSLASLVGPYNGMGNVLLEQHRYEEARTYYQRALTLAGELGDRTQVGLSHMHLGQCASLQGRFGEAKNEFAMALSALEETSFWNALARAYECIAEMNMRLGNIEEAVRCADKRIDLAHLHKNLRMESGAWRQKAAALRMAGRGNEAEACLDRAQSAATNGLAEPG